MAGWITHMMIADRILTQMPGLDRTGFCIGSIAPDCNIENEDWSAFTPPREITHWMRGERKAVADCEVFFGERIAGRSFACPQEKAFFLGYYAHLLTDACFQSFIRDEDRVRNMLSRIHAQPVLSVRMAGQTDDFDGVKRAFKKRERTCDVEQLEYEYLRDHPDSGYLTVLRTVKEFPDYMDILPEGAIVRKLGIMAVLPQRVDDAKFAFFTREEYAAFVDKTCRWIVDGLKKEDEQ